MRLDAPPLWLAGYPVNVTFESFDSYPAPRHQCRIEASAAAATATPWNMTLLSTTIESVKGNLGATLLNVKSVFAVQPVKEMTGSSVHCEVIPSTGIRIKFQEPWLFQIPTVTDPCINSITFSSNANSNYLEAGQIEQVQVTSHRCETSGWPVSHSCWLTVGSDAELKLKKISQTGFSSVHQLKLTKSMTNSDWQVRCQVNQSMQHQYPDVYSRKSDQPKVFFRGRTNLEGFDVETNKLLSINISVSEAWPPISSIVCQLFYFTKGQLEEVRVSRYILYTLCECVCVCVHYEYIRSLVSAYEAA
uniref:Ig-like domain-containing protein n=1 Tax=Macrostomum lignano TaxID=282301 RepID=A0A1I8HNH9_9PLAT